MGLRHFYVPENLPVIGHSQKFCWGFFSKKCGPQGILTKHSPEAYNVDYGVYIAHIHEGSKITGSSIAINFINV